MKNKFEFIHLDKRVIQRRLERREIEKSDYEKILKSLHDDAANSEPLRVVNEKENFPEDISEQN